MVLDRALNHLSYSTSPCAWRPTTVTATDARQLLTVALRDFVTPQEAENKTRKVLTRVWVVPPTNAQAMIRWAIEHQDEVIDRRTLHFGRRFSRRFRSSGASLRRLVDRSISTARSTDEPSEPSPAPRLASGRSSTLVHRRVSQRYGISASSVDRRTGPYRIEAPLAVPASFSAWFLHALILTRQVDSAGTDECVARRRVGGPGPCAGLELVSAT